MAEPPPFPTEKVRLALQAVLEWVMWRLPGPAVSGSFELEDFTGPQPPAKEPDNEFNPKE